MRGTRWLGYLEVTPAVIVLLNHDRRFCRSRRSRGSRHNSPRACAHRLGLEHWPLLRRLRGLCDYWGGMAGSVEEVKGVLGRGLWRRLRLQARLSVKGAWLWLGCWWWAIREVIELSKQIRGHGEARGDACFRPRG